MKSDDLLGLIGETADWMIMEADKPVKRTNFRYVKFVGFVASLCIAVAALLVFKQLMSYRDGRQQVGGGSNTNTANGNGNANPFPSSTSTPLQKGVTLPKLTAEQLDGFYQAGVENNSDKLLGFNPFDVVALHYDGQIYTMSRHTHCDLGTVHSENIPSNGWSISIADYPLEKICDVYGDVFVKPVYGDANDDGHISGVYAWHDNESDASGEYRKGTLWKFGEYDTKNVVALTVQADRTLLGEPEYELYIFYHLNDITLETGKDLLDIILDPLKASGFGIQMSLDPITTLSGDKPEDVYFLGDIYKGTVIDEKKVKNCEVISRINILEKEPYNRSFYFDNYGDGIIGYRTPEGTTIFIKTEWGKNE